ncbi:hypothetical protein IFM5058_11036.1, partial [Aspergillus udagawae]
MAGAMPILFGKQPLSCFQSTNEGAMDELPNPARRRPSPLDPPGPLCDHSCGLTMERSRTSRTIRMKGSWIARDGGVDVDLTNQWPQCRQRAYAQQSAFDSIVTGSRVHTKNEIFDLPGPLSELTQTMTHIPVRDMHTWVQRSIEERHQEVLKRRGRIPRPMNSFMLYRSAYADRAKLWTTAHNN